MKEIRRGEFLPHLAPVRQLLVFPALGTSYEFSSLSYSFSRALQHLLVFTPYYTFPALGSSYSISRRSCVFFFYFLPAFDVVHLSFKRVSFLLVLVAAVLSISEMILFLGGGH